MNRACTHALARPPPSEASIAVARKPTTSLVLSHRSPLPRCLWERDARNERGEGLPSLPKRTPQTSAAKGRALPLTHLLQSGSFTVETPNKAPYEAPPGTTPGPGLFSFGTGWCGAAGAALGAGDGNGRHNIVLDALCGANYVVHRPRHRTTAAKHPSRPHVGGTRGSHENAGARTNPPKPGRSILPQHNPTGEYQQCVTPAQ
jgi:hypothetical protein